jgi:glycosyltransferase involved in cell wall biosynthesis
MVMPSYYPVVGGMEIQIERQIPYLRESGIDVTILTRRTAGTTAHEMHDGTEIRRIAIPGGPGLRSISFTALGSLDIARQRKSVDIIHAHSIMSPTTIAALAGTTLRKPIVVTAHQSYEPAHLLAKPLGRQRLRLYQRLIDRFIIISSDIERLLIDQGIPATRLVSIPNGIDTTTFSPADTAERASLRTSLNLPTDEVIAVFVGRLQPVKQVDVLLHAWAGLDCGRLVILGDGHERPALESLSRELGSTERVEFKGMVPNVVDYLRAADIFVLPSASEGLSVALLEAMSTGLLPIATAIGGTTDVISDGESGLLVESGDINGLQQALDRALTDHAWRTTAAQAARATATSRYDLRTVAESLASVYRDVLGRRM